MITLMVFTNGRDDLLFQTLDSFVTNVQGPVTRVIVNDDTGDPEHLEMLKKNIVIPTAKNITWLQTNQAGFNGAIDSAWKSFKNCGEYSPFIFHLEDDFLFNREIDLWEMMTILDTEPWMAQIALMRQPWNQMEREAGSLYELHKGSFKQICRMTSKYVRHNMWFTTNPSLYRRELVKQFDWPMVQHSEGTFTATLRENDFDFGYMGSILDEPWVTHIGYERIGHGY